MSKRTIAAVLCIGALGLVAAGCSDDDESASATPATEQMTAEPAAASEDIVALAQGNDDLATLVAAVTAGDLVETLQGKGPFTVFAPTNQAFADVQDTVDELLKPENKKQLASVLTYHVVPGEVKAADLKDGQKLETVNGETLTVSVDGDTVKINDATVVAADVAASNGVVHVVDKVLVPKS